MKKAVCYILLFVTGMAAGMLLSRPCFKESDRTVLIHRDTTVTVDTNIYLNPLPVSSDISINDSIIIPPAEITFTYDNLIVLPMETRIYAGKDYRAQVSGFRPNLDWIQVFPETRYITTENISVASRKRWGIGIQAGYGIGLNEGRIYASPYIGIGISYDFIRF